MTKWLWRGMAAGALLLLLLDAVGARFGLVAGAIPKLPGQAAWHTARAAGLVAQAALWLDMVFGLLVSTGAADRWIPRARSVELHRFLSGATLTFVALHVLTLLLDSWIHFDGLDLLLPFVAPYRRFATGLGVLAAWGVIALHASFELRKRIGPKSWRLIHHTSFVVFVLATLHGAFAGTDLKSGWPLVVHVASFGVVVALVVLRLVAASRTPVAARGTRARSPRTD